MNAKERYDKKNPVITFRLKEKLVDIMDKYIEDNGEYSSRSNFVAHVINEYFIKEKIITIKYEYEYEKKNG